MNERVNDLAGPIAEALLEIREVRAAIDAPRRRSRIEDPAVRHGSPSTEAPAALAEARRRSAGPNATRIEDPTAPRPAVPNTATLGALEEARRRRATGGDRQSTEAIGGDLGPGDRPMPGRTR